MSINWVMLKRNGEIEPLENETVLFQSRQRVSFDLSVPSQLRTPNSKYTIKCDDGLAFVTTTRVIYLPSRPTDTFKSFSAFILDLSDARPSASGWLGMGAWCWIAEATPRPGGGIPADIPRVKIVLTFNDGGMDGFHNKYKTMYERLLQARDVARETGQRMTVHDDDLPAYSAASAMPISTTERMASPPPVPQAAAEQTRPDPLPPTEPPPGYDEAQVQAMEIRFDERERRDAERNQ